MNKAKWLMPLMVIVLMAFAAGIASAQSTPVADDQALTTDEDTPVAITLTGSDADDDPLTYSVVSGPSNGTLEGTPPDLTYTPDADYNGDDSFTFTVSDGSENSNEATVSITVNPVNDPPVADDQALTTDEDTPVAITLTGSDADDDPLTYSVVNGPSNGMLEGTPPDLTYTPDADYNGDDSFTFTVSDGSEDSNEATVSITVNPVNDPPVANDQEVATDENVAVEITLTGTDVDDDPLTYSVVSGPSNGTLEGTPPDLTYIPDADYNGDDSFTFTASDGSEDSNEATVSITVGGEEDIDEDGDMGSRKGFVGTVMEVDGNEICITKHGETCVEIIVPSDLTRVKTPSRNKGEDLDGQWFLDWISDPEGQEGPVVVAVLAENTGSGWEAVQILVKPDKANAPKIGTTIAVDEEGNQITILTPKGKKYTITLPEDQGLPEEGEVVTVFEDPDGADEGEAGGPVKAKGLVKASQIRERLEQHLASLTQGDEDLSGEDVQLVNELAELLINHTGQHLGILKKLSEEDLPSATKEIISGALAKTNNANQQAQLTAAQARAKAASAENRGKPENPGNNGKSQGLGTTDDGADGGKPSNKGNSNQGKGSTGSGKGKG